MTERRLSLGTGRKPNAQPVVSPSDVLRALLSLKVGSEMATELGNIVRSSDSEFQLVVKPDHFRGALDALMLGGI